MKNDQQSSRKGEPFESLPGPVQEAINAHAKYYAEHHGLGMSLRDDLTYIAQVALRWAPKPTPSDGGLDLAQELRTVLSWEGKRMGAMSAGVLRQVIGRIEKASERSETGPSLGLVHPGDNCPMCGEIKPIPRLGERGGEA